MDLSIITAVYGKHIANCDEAFTSDIEELIDRNNKTINDGDVKIIDLYSLDLDHLKIEPNLNLPFVIQKEISDAFLYRFYGG